MDPAARKQAWARQERDELAEPRAAPDLSAAIELAAVTVAELARRAASEDELARTLAADPPVDLTARWRGRR